MTDVASAPTGMSDDELQARIKEIKWFHQIPIRDGIVTPGCDDSASKLIQVSLPSDLSGKSVLDIGAWDGFFSFQAERNGAARVLATDHFCWSGPGWGTDKGFKLVHEALNSKVEAKDIPVEQLSPETVGQFDVVLFLGVLYHLEDPMAGLKIAASVCKELLIIETQMDDLHRRKPSMVYFPGDLLNNDDTNFWAPNVGAMRGMLKDLGFKRVEIAYPKNVLRYSFPVRLLSSIKGKFQGRGPIRHTINQGRMTFHAYR